MAQSERSWVGLRGCKGSDATVHASGYGYRRFGWRWHRHAALRPGVLCAHLGREASLPTVPRTDIRSSAVLTETHIKSNFNLYASYPSVRGSTVVLRLLLVGTQATRHPFAAVERIGPISSIISNAMKKATLIAVGLVLCAPMLAFADSTVTATADSGSTITPSGTVVVPTATT